MTLHEAAHHVGLARRTKRGADLLRLLHRDQAVDDIGALHEQAMHLLVDIIDFAAQVLKRNGSGRRLGHREA